MDEHTFLAMADGEALHLAPDRAVDWSNPLSAASNNELYHVCQYLWFRACIAGAGVSGRLLDVACGTGYGLAMLAEMPQVESAVGLDLNARHVASANAIYPTLDCRIGDCEKLGAIFAPGEFQFITSGQTLEHLYDPVSFVEGAASCLRDDGIFIVMMPAHDTVSLPLNDRNPNHLMEYDGATTQRLLSFFFHEVRLGSERPETSALEPARSIMPGEIFPAAEACYCRHPRRDLNANAVTTFRADFLLSTYAAIVHARQDAMIEDRRLRHFLRGAYSFLDFKTGFFVPELDKVWCAPKAIFVVDPQQCGRRYAFSFFAAAKASTPIEVAVIWNDRERHYHLTTREIQHIDLGRIDEPTMVAIETTPGVRPRDLGIADMRTLGICIVRFEEQPALAMAG